MLSQVLQRHRPGSALVEGSTFLEASVCVSHGLASNVQPFHVLKKRPSSAGKLPTSREGD